MIGIPLKVQIIPQVGRPCPDLTLRHPDGSPFRLSSLRGHFVVIEFTAYACAPCLQVAPEFEKLAESLPDVVFLTVSTGPESELPRLAALRGKEAKTILLKDPYDADRSKMQVWKFGNVGTPTMFVITPHGRIGSRPMQEGARDFPRLRSRIAWLKSRGEPPDKPVH